MDHSTPAQWGKGKLLAILIGAVLAAVLLLLGLALSVREALVTTGEDASSRAATGQDHNESAPPGATRREQLAAAPMLTVEPEAATGGSPSTKPAPAFAVPSPTKTGPGNVATGLPHTPAGAVAQLAAIDTTVLQAMSIPATHHIHDQWSHPDAPPAGQWSMTRNVQSFLASAQQPGQSTEAGVTVTARPVAGQVKGTDGKDWVLACVLLDVRVTITAQARVAYGHCEAMTWDAGRWVIAPGNAPAPAPSTWPGTDLAHEAGWRTWAPTRALARPDETMKGAQK